MAYNIRRKSQYKLKLTEQIYISENREKFLAIEMKRAKTNLGKLIKEKEIVDEKIKLIAQLEKDMKKISILIVCHLKKWLMALFLQNSQKM